MRNLKVIMSNDMWKDKELVEDPDMDSGFLSGTITTSEDIIDEKSSEDIKPEPKPPTKTSPSKSQETSETSKTRESYKTIDSGIDIELSEDLNQLSVQEIPEEDVQNAVKLAEFYFEKDDDGDT